MSNQDGHLQEGSLRRIRSAGDIPRRPEMVYFRSNLRTSEGTSDDQDVNSHSVSYTLPSNGVHQLPPSAPPVPTSSPTLGSSSTSENHPPFPAHLPPQSPQMTLPVNNSELNRSGSIPRHLPLYMRLMMYFGIGRRASHARKSLVSLIWNVSWGFFQVVTIITMLILTGTHFMSPKDSSLSEWTACDRPLGVWASLWVVRVVLASVLAYWEFKRDRVLHPAHSDTETNSTSPQLPAMANGNTTAAHGNHQPVNNPLAPAALPDATILPHSRAFSRLTLLSSLMTLSWFLTAHILEYTSISTCRHTSPHLWWLVFGILCIMYLMVLEVVLLGFVVLVIAPILFIFWNIFLICIGRHPLQNPHMIKPEIGKLPKSVVERIPLVMYIPTPPEGENNVMLQTPHAYPPKSYSPMPTVPQKRFKLLHKISSFGSKKADREKDDKREKKDDSTSDNQDPISWEQNWEQSEYPFVALEGNRAACAICLMDFEEPKRKHSPADTSNDGPREQYNQPTVSDDADKNNRIQPLVTITEEGPGEQLMLEDAGDGAQPLRLLACGHVFHKTCLDPWLTDVSGRCPVCQKAVELPTKNKKKARRHA